MFAVWPEGGGPSKKGTPLGIKKESYEIRRHKIDRVIAVCYSTRIVSVGVVSVGSLLATRAASRHQRQYGHGNPVARRRSFSAAPERAFDGHLVAQSAAHGCRR